MCFNIPPWELCFIRQGATERYDRVTDKPYSYFVDTMFKSLPKERLFCVAWKFRLTHDSGRTKQVWLVPDAACTVFELLLMSGKTTRNMQSTDNDKEYCITLHLVGYAYEYINNARSQER